MENSNQMLQKIIDCLKQNINILPEESKTVFEKLDTYNNAFSSIEQDIFNLLDFTNLMDEIGVSKEAEYVNLIQTLSVLKDNYLLTLTDNQINEIRNSKIFKYCVNGILYYKKKYMQQYENEKTKIDQNEKLDDVIKRLKSSADKIIDDELVEEIYSLIFNKILDERSCIMIRKLIFEYNIEIFNNIKFQIDDLKERISDDELSEVFTKFGYDYLKVPDDFKRKLRIKGNIENITEVFECLNDYHIKFEENNIISICLLLKSDRAVIEKIIYLSKKYSFDYYEVIKEFPSIIMHKGKSKKRTSNSIQDINGISGSFEDFEENIKTIEELGYDIKTALEKTMSIFIVSNNKIERNISALRQYGFPKKLAHYGFKLSGLKSDNITDNIDKFIELGEIEYIQNNTSRLIEGKNSFIFYRLYFVKKYNEKIKNDPTKKPYLSKKKQKDKYILTGIISTKNDNTLASLIDYSSIINFVFDEQIDHRISQFVEEKSKEGYSYEISTDDLIDKIESNYLKNNIMYDFDGIIISRLKVLRIYSLLISSYPEYSKEQLLLFAVTYNSILDHDEFNRIKSIIKKEKIKCLV